MKEQSPDRTPGTVTSNDWQSPHTPRPPAKYIQLLLPIWGFRYFKQFIEYGLPTLIAPGNLPALAKALPCKLVFLTSTSDAETVSDSPAVRYLRTVCDVEFQLIDDLITGSNYSTTITLAYERAVRAAGSDMLDTCFFFLISDYLMTDGSLRNVLARIQGGASGVFAGNFQIVEEDASKTFHRTFEHGTPDIVLPARDLLRWALKYLHPMTAANTVNFPLCKSAHSNRLFWRLDENTLIGRFYLMHMICIRPEVTDFVIGSSCDYSFIPEMCPSDNVHVIDDSDEYLVVEMQPRTHEQAFLRMGPVVAKELVPSLSEWTTERHRKNAKTAVIFHAQDIPAQTAAVVAESAAFIESVGQRLSKPQPVRDHPYWIGAIAAHNWAVARRNRGKPEKGLERPASASVVGTFARAREFLFGRPPKVRQWHPRWPDYQRLSMVLGSHVTASSSLLLVSEAPTELANWIGEISQQTTNVQSHWLVAVNEAQYTPMVRQFDGCLLVVSNFELSLAEKLIERIRPLLTDDGFIMVAAINGSGIALTSEFGNSIAHSAARFFDLGMPVDEIHFVSVGTIRLASLRALVWLYVAMYRNPYFYFPIAALLGGPLIAASAIGNLLAARHHSGSIRSGISSSLFMVMRGAGSQAKLPDFSLDRDLLDEATRYRLDADSEAKAHVA